MESLLNQHSHSSYHILNTFAIYSAYVFSTGKEKERSSLVGKPCIHSHTYICVSVRQRESKFKLENAVLE